MKADVGAGGGEPAHHASWGLSLSFVGILALCGRLGPFTGALTLSVGFVLIGLPFLLRLLATRSRPGLRPLGWFVAGAVALAGAALLPACWRAAAAAADFDCWSRGSVGVGDRAGLRVLAAGSALFAIVLPWFDVFPALFVAQEGWSGLVSALAGAATARPVSAGASALGFDALLLLVCLALAPAVSSGARARGVAPRVGRALLLGHGVCLGWAVALAFLPGFDAPLQLRPPPTLDPLPGLWALVAPRLPLWGTWLVAAALSVVVARLLPAPAPLPEPGAPDPTKAVDARGGRGAARGLAVAGSVALLAFAGGTGAWLEQPRAGRGALVVLYEKGFVNWLRPSFGFYGRESAGMFGMLPTFLGSLGLHVRRTPVLDSVSLRHASVVFIANVETALSAGERDSLWRYIRDGGHLVLLGDHTWQRGTGGNPLNAILEPTAIRYRFDSANFFTPGWSGGYRFLVNPLTAGLSGEDNGPCMVVGASLEIGPDARPLLVGRWGHADAAALSDSAGGFLGDLQYGRGERIGDLVLIATQRLGKGRVTVLGDTSPFFNGILCSSYPFVARLLLWAVSKPAEPPFRLFLLDVVLALAVGLVLARASGRAGAALLAGALLGALVGTFGIEQQKRWPTPFVQGNLAFVDDSHLPVFPVGDWDEGAIMGLPVGLMRCGYQTHFLERLDDPALNQARLLVMVAPRRRVSPREADRVLDWVARGSTLILSVGAEEETAARALLGRLGVSLRPVPLGNVLVDGPRGPVHTAEAWVVETASAVDRDPEVLLRSGDFPIAVRLRWGRGRVVVIGDSQFFVNFNLEHGEHVHLANEVFLADLVGAEVPAPLVQEVTRAGR